ncbi:S28A3-like protein [Mya arenaria]|uniref:S28A3-like protein n=1 Tax=Mya arenaria TaxID=6604 RepID=A0ABY7DW72_MYAAR|nr:S28A3-like protein [Mya arenaria]
MDSLRQLRNCSSKHHDKFEFAFRVLLLIAYFVYFGFAVSYHVGDEGSWRLIVATVFGIWLIVWHFLKRTHFYVILVKFSENALHEFAKGKRSLVVNWHTVFWAMTLQFIMALLILKTTWGASIIQWCGERLQEFTRNGRAGSLFMFGEKYTDHPFVFGALPQAIAVIVGMSVLTYLGAIKFIVETVGRCLAFFLGISPAEGINAVGNIFLHVPESAMLIQEYIADMTPSELFVTYAGGLSTVGGTALVIFMASGVPAAPLVAASAMSAPAALAAAKLSFPSYDQEEVPIPSYESKNREKPSFLQKPTSLMHSIIIGINQSVVLMCQAVFFIMTFVIILEWINNTLIWFGDRIGVEQMTAEYLLGYIFYPFAYMMGTRVDDCLFVGQLLGIRTFSLAVVAYPKLGPIMLNGQDFREYVAASPNNTWSWVGNDLLLHETNTTLVGGVIDARSEIIATYALCGSASFAIMGLIIGSFEAIVQHRIGEITQNIFRALLVGTVASYLTACFAGLLYEGEVAFE